jgi:TRAP-type C4-dicarboxylate transport system substrate-binding protein
MDYIYPTNHTWGSNMVTINLDAWNRLSPENQAIVEDVAARLEPEFWEVSRQGDIDSIAVMAENGMKLMDISDELRAEMAERAQQLQADFIARVPDAAPIVDQFKASR